MGYRCPVCDDPQADDVHLANHLAFTAIVRGGDHEAWLDEHVPEWGDMGETDLAPRVAERAESAEYPAVFEDTRDTHEHGHGHDRADRSRSDDGANAGGRPEMAELPFETGMDDEARTAIEQAREMTRKRRANAADDGPEQADSEGEQ